LFYEINISHIYYSESAVVAGQCPVVLNCASACPGHQNEAENRHNITRPKLKACKHETHTPFMTRKMNEIYMIHVASTAGQCPVVLQTVLTGRECRQMPISAAEDSAGQLPSPAILITSCCSRWPWPVQPLATRLHSRDHLLSGGISLDARRKPTQGGQAAAAFDLAAACARYWLNRRARRSTRNNHMLLKVAVGEWATSSARVVAPIRFPPSCAWLLTNFEFFLNFFIYIFEISTLETIWLLS